MGEPRGKMEQVRQMCRRLRPILGPRMDQLFLAYRMEDDEGKEQIEAYLEALTAQHLPQGIEESATGDLVPPSREQAWGEYPIGTVVYAGKPLYEFGIREKELIQHLACFGRTGAGKTNFGFNLFRQFHKKGKPVLVFDWKRNYRDLLALPGFQDLEVYTIGQGLAPLSFNPLIPPPGTRPKTWLKKIIGVVAHAYMLGNGVLYLLQQSLDAVYEEFGVYTGQAKIYPTFRDVLAKVKDREAHGREAGWLASTLRALASLCFGDMDTLVNEGNNRMLDHMLEKSVILELDALTQSDKVFFIQAMLLWIHHRRMAEGGRETFKHAVFIEEAHQVLSNERQSLMGGQSVMDITFREIREFGECLVLFDQHPSEISLPALGNTYTTVSMNLKHAKDVGTMAQAMLLDGDEKDLLGSLKVGEAIVKSQGRIPKPFLIHVPEFTLRKGAVSNEMVRAHMASVMGPMGAVDPCSGLVQDAAGETPGRSADEGGQASIDARFLSDVRKCPESGIAERYKRLGLSVRQGQKLKAYLIKSGLVTEDREHTHTGRLNRIRFTEKGKAFLSQTQDTQLQGQH
jgi:hypothetical protein